ncbi:MAG: energy transducer TonB [Candidatus Omnitrophota bacterium]
MGSNNVFRITLLISVIAHGALLFNNPNFNFFPAKDQEQKITKVNYVLRPKETKPAPKLASSARESLMKMPPKVNIEDTIMQPLAQKENLPNRAGRISPEAPSLNKPFFSKPDIIAIKKKIIFPPIDLEKINNPSYISYYQVVREKIKRCAYQIYTGKETGEVTISFIISDDGFLKELRLIEEKSSASQYLKETALRSVNEASPFPNFPKELDYPKLSFNLTITFEVE